MFQYVISNCHFSLATIFTKLIDKIYQVAKTNKDDIHEFYMLLIIGDDYDM